MVESKLDSEAAQIFWDFGLVFVVQIIALQLVDFVELSLSVPFRVDLKKGFFLKMLAMFPTSLTCPEGF